MKIGVKIILWGTVVPVITYLHAAIFPWPGPYELGALFAGILIFTYAKSSGWFNSMAIGCIFFSVTLFVITWIFSRERIYAAFLVLMMILKTVGMLGVAKAVAEESNDWNKN